MYYKYTQNFSTCKIAKSSATLDTILAYIYRKRNLLCKCGRYSKDVLNGLEKLGLIKKVVNRKGTYYFSTEKSQNFKAMDFAKEYLWHFHNPQQRKIINQKRMILVYDSSLPDGKDLVEVQEAIKKGYM